MLILILRAITKKTGIYIFLNELNCTFIKYLYNTRESNNRAKERRKYLKYETDTKLADKTYIISNDINNKQILPYMSGSAGWNIILCTKKVFGLVPGHGKYLGCGSTPGQSTYGGKATSLHQHCSFLSLSLPPPLFLSLKSRKHILREDFKKAISRFFSNLLSKGDISRMNKNMIKIYVTQKRQTLHEKKERFKKAGYSYMMQIVNKSKKSRLF